MDCTDVEMTVVVLSNHTINDLKSLRQVKSNQPVNMCGCCLSLLLIEQKSERCVYSLEVRGHYSSRAEHTSA